MTTTTIVALLMVIMEGGIGKGTSAFQSPMRGWVLSQQQRQCHPPIPGTKTSARSCSTRSSSSSRRTALHMSTATQDATASSSNNNNDDTTTTTTAVLRDSTSTSTSSTDSDSSQTPRPTSGGGGGGLPVLGPDGVYHIENQEQHAAFLQANKDQLVVLKCFAPWCRACKGLEPKYLQLVHDTKYQDLPIVWADLSIQHNKKFVQTLGVLALPTIQFYTAGSLTDTFACGPSKVPILKRKLTSWINDTIDPKTRQLKTSAIEQAAATAAAGGGLASAIELTPDNATTITTTVLTANGTDTTTPTASSSSSSTSSTSSTPYQVLITPEQRKELREIPYFKELSLADFDQVMDKAKELQFAAGSILMREGRPGRTFYVLKEGEVEICQKSIAPQDPLVDNSQNYLGTVINRLGPGEYFGERAVITGEPRAASIRVASDDPVTLWAWDKDDFPASSVLSGRTKGIQDDFDLLDDKYGVSLSDLLLAQNSKQWQEATLANQVRGSVNTPYKISGVDTEDDVAAIVDDSQTSMAAEVDAGTLASTSSGLIGNDAMIMSLLNKFKLIRNVQRCFEYMVKMRVQWGDAGIRKRRSMLVSRLSVAQRAEFVETFKLIDRSGDGAISLLELKRVLASIGEARSDEELLAMIAQVSGLDSRSVITFPDFMGIMAEAEFYYLFRDIFATLDVTDSGFIKASELDRVLSGVRDLVVSDDHKNKKTHHKSSVIIDVDDDDQDMLIDYEQYTRMLLGTVLI